MRLVFADPRPQGSTCRPRELPCGRPQFSGRNQTTNVANAAGQTGAAIFNNYSGVSATNNTRPAGDTRQLGTFFGEHNAARDPRIIQLGVKLYF